MIEKQEKMAPLQILPVTKYSKQPETQIQRDVNDIKRIMECEKQIDQHVCTNRQLNFELKAAL